jgi:hypothetical protein
MMTKFLKMAHLLHDHGMPKVQVRSGRVKAHLDAERRAPTELLAQISFVDQFGATTLDKGQLGIDIHCHHALSHKFCIGAHLCRKCCPRQGRTRLSFALNSRIIF